MSDADPDADEELDAIRAEKRERLQTQLEDAGEPVHVESATHLNELVASGITLVDFHAEWCGPCKMLEPVVKDIAAETDAAVAKVDIDELQAVARDYQVQGVPTLYLFVDGEIEERWVGVQAKDTLVSAIEAVA